MCSCARKPVQVTLAINATPTTAAGQNMRVGSAKTVKKGIPELKSAGLVADAASGEPTLTDKGHKTSV
jgi:hypothetical protein